MAQEIHTYADLLQQIHNDLRIQHPEWIQQNGESPMCDSYEARLIELLDGSRPMESNENIALPDRELSAQRVRFCPKILASVFARANSYLFAIRRKSKKTRAKTQMRWH